MAEDRTIFCLRAKQKRGIIYELYGLRCFQWIAVIVETVNTIIHRTIIGFLSVFSADEKCRVLHI